MKKEVSFFNKLQACFMYLFDTNRPMTLVCCEFCLGNKIRFLEGESIRSEDDENRAQYDSKYQCMSCNAIATNVEVWTHE